MAAENCTTLLKQCSFIISTFLRLAVFGVKLFFVFACTQQISDFPFRKFAIIGRTRTKAAILNTFSSALVKSVGASCN